MSSSDTFIVVEDPRGEYWEGSVVEAQRARHLMTEGVALLPVEPKLFRLGSISGYSKRCWGAGVSLSNQGARSVAPLTLFVSPGYGVIHWMARIVPDPLMQHIKEYNGILRLSHDTQQPGALTTGLMTPLTVPPELCALGAPDARGGWTISGSHKVSAAQEGFMALCIFGTAPGLRLAWAAATQVQ